MSRPTEAAARASSIVEEIRNRFGMYPTLFSSMADVPEVLEHFWGRTQFAYLDNPLPARFKEEVFVFLSRYCGKPYCLARHAAFLLSNGNTAGSPGSALCSEDEVMSLLTRPLPSADDFEFHLGILNSMEGPLDAKALENTPAKTKAIGATEETEASLLACIVPLFTGASRQINVRYAEVCESEIRRILGVPFFGHLLTLLSYIREVHFAVETYPQISFDADIIEMFGKHEMIANWINNHWQPINAGVSVTGGTDTEPSSIELALRESEANLTALIENTTDIILSVDRFYRILTFNSVVREVFKNLWGIELKTGLNILEQVPPELAVVWKERYDRALKGERFSIEERSDYGEDPVYFEVSFSPIVNLGSVTGVSVFSRDISDRKLAESELRKSEERLRLVFSQQFQFMAILSPDGHILEINDTPIKIQGFTREQFLGRLFWEGPAWTDLPGWPDRIRAHIERAITCDGPVVTEDLYHTIDGEVRSADAAYTALRNSSGEIQFILVAAKDNTDKRNAERALHESESLFRSAFRDAAVPTAIQDPAGAYLQVNAAFSALVGWSEEELIGRSYQEITHEDDRHLDATFEEQLQSGQISSLKDEEKRFRHKDGSAIWTLVSASVVHDPNGRCIYRVVQIQDITERKQVEVATQQAAVASAQISMLSPRENDVLGEVVAGHANKVIARHLDISEKTVEKHRSNLMKKLRVRSVAELVRLAMLAENTRYQ